MKCKTKVKERYLDEEKWMQVPGVDKVDEGGSFACVNMLSCTSWELRNCFCVWD